MKRLARSTTARLPTRLVVAALLALPLACRSTPAQPIGSGASRAPSRSAYASSARAMSRSLSTVRQFRAVEATPTVRSSRSASLDLLRPRGVCR